MWQTYEEIKKKKYCIPKSDKKTSIMRKIKYIQGPSPSLQFFP